MKSLAMIYLFDRIVFFTLIKRWKKVTTPTIGQSSNVTENDTELKEKMLIEHTTSLTNV